MFLLLLLTLCKATLTMFQNYFPVIELAGELVDSTKPQQRFIKGKEVIWVSRVQDM